MINIWSQLQDLPTDQFISMDDQGIGIHRVDVVAAKGKVDRQKKGHRGPADEEFPQPGSFSGQLDKVYFG